MRHILCLFLFYGFSIFGFSQNNSSIDFVIKNLGINVDGHFNSFTIDAEFNSNGDITNLLGKINVSSIETGIDSRDEHLLEEEYFYTKKYKNILLKSIGVVKNSKGVYNIKSKLTIKGKVKTITIPITVKKINNTYKITSSFEINRRDFDVGGSSFVMSKTVKINVVHYEDYQ